MRTALVVLLAFCAAASFGDEKPAALPAGAESGLGSEVVGRQVQAVKTSMAALRKKRAEAAELRRRKRAEKRRRAESESRPRPLELRENPKP